MCIKHLEKGMATPVFLPGEFHGQRSLAGYSPWGHTELDITEWLRLSLSIIIIIGYVIYWVLTMSQLPSKVILCTFLVGCLVAQLCLTLCNPMDCSPPGSSVHGILQARILEWVAMPFSRGSSWPGDRTCVSRSSCSAGRFFSTEPLGKLWEAPFTIR